jgi:hypothetical protein
MIETISKLPDKPSELVDVALRDIEACMQDPHYSWAPQSWHRPTGTGATCLVCLAGAVMSQTLQVPLDVRCDPSSFHAPGVADKLLALDALRTGRLATFLVMLGVKPEESVTIAEEPMRALVPCVSLTLELLIPWLKIVSAKLKEADL